MPVFDITGPDGKAYEIEGADAPGALAALQKHLGAKPPEAAPSMGAGEVAADVAKSGGIGLVKGGIGAVGAAGDLRTAAGAGVDAAGSMLGFDPSTVKNAASKIASLTPITNALNYAPTSQDIQSKIEGAVGTEFYKPKTTLGEYAQTAGEFAPAALGGEGSLIARGARVLLPAAASESAGQITKGSSLEPWARTAAAILTPAAGAAARRVASPFQIDPARQRLINVLEGEGVDSLTAGQRTGNKSLQYAESILGDGPFSGGRASEIQQQGQRQFTEAAMRRAGGGADAAPETLRANNTRLGNEFERLSNSHDLVPDNHFIDDITHAVRDYRNVPPSQQRAIVQGYVDDVIEHINHGQMPGPQYQEMRSRLSRQANSLRQSDPTLSDTLRDFRNALDNAMGRSIPAAEQAAWQTARREYGSQKVIEKAASRAGEATAEGQVTPANLRNTAAAENRGAYARGEGDFSELGRAGVGVMSPLPNSGTAQRNLATDILKIPATATIGRLLMSGPMQNYLSNQRFAPMQGGEAARRALANALLAAETSPSGQQPRQ